MLRRQQLALGGAAALISLITIQRAWERRVLTAADVYSAILRYSGGERKIRDVVTNDFDVYVEACTVLAGCGNIQSENYILCFFFRVC